MQHGMSIGWSMGKSLYIAEKPSVAREFAKALKLQTTNKDGYMEAEEAIISWCVGHLVTMSYPEAYDVKYKRWTLNTLPFIPQEFQYEVIENVRKQFKIVSTLLHRKDVDIIYVCTDSGREGEYIYRLVERQAGLTGKERRRVWIDSQTEAEILRGIKEAKNLSEYDNLGSAAYLRAKEDYLMGINFSRVLTLKYGDSVRSYLKLEKAVVSVGRVMTCVLGMAVKREREIRSFVKTPFYRVIARTEIGGRDCEAEWKAAEHTRYFNSPLLYKENGFKSEATAQELIAYLSHPELRPLVLDKIEKKKEVKTPPLLYNLAELQNDCSRFFRVSPDETLRIVQELYEKKLTTYPRTDARVLSSAVCKEIAGNIRGLTSYTPCGSYADEVLKQEMFKGLAKTRYVNDKQITDHYAIIPTGQGLNNLRNLSPTAACVYEIIVRRFLSIFYPAAVYQKVTLTLDNKGEKFFLSFKILAEEGYLKVAGHAYGRKKTESKAESNVDSNVDRNVDSNTPVTSDEKEERNSGTDKSEDIGCDMDFLQVLSGLKKGLELAVRKLEIKEGETTPPKRYNSGSMILTMENAGQFIEDEELRAQIKGSGIGTSATRAEILKKLVTIKYLALNKKTQIITPTLLGEMIFDIVNNSIRALLDPALTASWEKGLTMVAEGTISEDEYMRKLSDFISRRTDQVKKAGNQGEMYRFFDEAAVGYRK